MYNDEQQEMIFEDNVRLIKKIDEPDTAFCLEGPLSALLDSQAIDNNESATLSDVVAQMTEQLGISARSRKKAGSGQS